MAERGSSGDEGETAGNSWWGGLGQGELSGWLRDGQRWVAGVALAGALLGGGVGMGFPQGAMASTPEETKKVGLCLLSSCQAELGKCILNPKCFANLICLQTCSSSSNESECQIRCGDLFENETVGKFNACAVSQKKCVPQRQDDGSYPELRRDQVVKKFDPAMMEGKWYISAGLNKAFDCFDCQVHFFASPEPGKLFAKLNWRIKEPDGEFFTRDVVQRFVQTKDNPALLLNHDNDYLHYKDDWYILDAEPNSHVLIYYRGSNDAWDGYGGAVVYTKEKNVPEKIVPRLREACKRAGIDWDKFSYNDNSCKPQDRETTALLRREYAGKLFLTEKDQLQEQLTAVRGNAASSFSATEKGAEQALAKLEDLKDAYQAEITFDVLELEDTVGKEVGELVLGAEKEVEFIEEEAKQLTENVERKIDTQAFKVREADTLKRLEEKLK